MGASSKWLRTAAVIGAMALVVTACGDGDEGGENGGSAFVVGGTTGIVNTPFGDAAAPMFQDPPGCLMHRQAGFIESSFTGEFGTEYNVTLMPPIDGGQGAVFSGDVAAVMTDKEAAGALVAFLVSTEGQEAWHSHEGSGSLSVRADFDSSIYPSSSLAAQGELLANTPVARFDGSDLMPSAVGGEAFFTQLVAWIGGQDLDTTLANIDAAWPADAGGGGEGGGGSEGSGDTVSMLHAIGGTEEQAALQAALDLFEQQTGTAVSPEYTDDIATTLGIRVDGNNPPDVVLHPQPGALAGFAAQGALTPLADVGVSSLDGLVPGMLETGTFDGTPYGVVAKAAVSSLLWYRSDVFESEDYSVPESWDDMVALSETIAGTGTAPWCIGIESGGATGWVATNWIEDAMLRLNGADAYDQWTSGELDFTSDEVKAAFEHVGEIFFGQAS